jgi:hypothetical protein
LKTHLGGQQAGKRSPLGLTMREQETLLRLSS